MNETIRTDSQYSYANGFSFKLYFLLLQNKISLQSVESLNRTFFFIPCSFSVVLISNQWPKGIVSPSFSPTSDKWTCKSTSYDTATGRFFLKQICSILVFWKYWHRHLEITIQKYLTLFKSVWSYFPCYGNELHPKDPYISAFYSEVDNYLTQFLSNQAPYWT